MIKLKLDIPSNIIKQDNGNNAYYTYFDGRSCRYCKTPFPDQTNRSHEFCERHVFSDGRIMDCKSLYWTPERRIESKITKDQQQLCSSLKELIENGRTEMSWEEFCFKGFSLKKASQTYTSADNQIVAIFTDGHILIDPNTYNIKIVSQ